ncbi:MAG: hypothetical protein HFH01_10500 [Dorea sp.]|nr:hypothetical protein [Dorea sp.]
MIYKGKVAPWWYVVTALINGVALAALIYQIQSDNLSVVFIGNLLLFLILDLYFVPAIFKNEVAISKKEVTVKFGLLTKEIPIQGISCVRRMKNYQASFAASFDRVGIESRGMSAVFISLSDSEAFIRELMRKNRKIKYLL